MQKVHIMWPGAALCGFCMRRRLRITKKLNYFQLRNFVAYRSKEFASRLHCFCVSMLRKLQRIMEQTIWRWPGVKHISLRKITKYEPGLMIEVGFPVFICLRDRNS